MKMLMHVLSSVLILLTVLLPLGTILSACFGYVFELADITSFAVATAVLSLCLTVLSLKAGAPTANDLSTVLLACLTPLSLLNTVFFVYACNSIAVEICMLISLGCSLFLTIRRGGPHALKTSALIASLFLFMPVLFFNFIVMIFGNLRQDTVVMSVTSPNGTYCAEVIDSDQGALGGNTVVYVCESNDIAMGIFTIRKAPQQVYLDRWRAYEDMDIYWKSDDCLVINSTEFTVA